MQLKLKYISSANHEPGLVQGDDYLVLYHFANNMVIWDHNNSALYTTQYASGTTTVWQLAYLSVSAEQVLFD